MAIMYLANPATSEVGCPEVPVEPVAAEEPMAHVRLTCPHCLTEKAGFSGTQFLTTAPYQYALLMQCGVCRECVVVKLVAPTGGFENWASGKHMGDPPKLVAVFPEPPVPDSPEHLPENVERYYVQGEDSLIRGNYDAAGTMFRKALDSGLKRLHAEGKGNLQTRIDALPPETGVTPAMKEWAHEIRHLGNDAAHEDEPFTKEEAESLKAFTELFLTYAFTLPGMLEARKPAPSST